MASIANCNKLPEGIWCFGKVIPTKNRRLLSEDLPGAFPSLGSAALHYPGANEVCGTAGYVAWAFEGWNDVTTAAGWIEHEIGGRLDEHSSKLIVGNLLIFTALCCMLNDFYQILRNSWMDFSHLKRPIGPIWSQRHQQRGLRNSARS